MAKTWATKCCSGTYKNNYQLCCGIKVYQNSSLIQTIGVLIALNGLFQVTLSWFTPEGVPTDTSYRIFVLLGVFIIFMGYLFKMGVRMREEQELTI